MCPDIRDDYAYMQPELIPCYEQNKAFAEAFQPLTGMDAERRETLHRRFKLPTEAKMECAKLDGVLVAQQEAVRTAEKPAAAGAEASLLVTRRRFRELRC